MIRLSAKLEIADHRVDKNKNPIKKDEIPELSLERKASKGGELLDISNQSQSKGKGSKGKGKKQSPPPTAPSRFSHRTKFDLLGDIPSDEDPTSLSLLPHSSINRGSPASEKRGRVPTTGAMMPPFNSDFWTVYGNKLRVNGTLEQFCSLSSD